MLQGHTIHVRRHINYDKMATQVIVEYFHP
jgi:hypothetical protein